MRRELHARGVTICRILFRNSSDQFRNSSRQFWNRMELFCVEKRRKEKRRKDLRVKGDLGLCLWIRCFAGERG